MCKNMKKIIFVLALFFGCYTLFANNISTEIIANNGFISKDKIEQLFEYNPKIEIIGWSFDSNYLAYRQQIENYGFLFVIYHLEYASTEIQIMEIITNPDLNKTTEEEILEIINNFNNLLINYSINAIITNPMENINYTNYLNFNSQIKSYFEYELNYNENVGINNKIIGEGIDWKLFVEFNGKKMNHSMEGYSPTSTISGLKIFGYIKSPYTNNKIVILWVQLFNTQIENIFWLRPMFLEQIIYDRILE